MLSLGFYFPLLKSTWKQKQSVNFPYWPSFVHTTAQACLCRSFFLVPSIFLALTENHWYQLLFQAWRPCSEGLWASPEPGFQPGKGLQGEHEGVGGEGRGGRQDWVVPHYGVSAHIVQVFMLVLLHCTTLTYKVCVFCDIYGCFLSKLLSITQINLI